MHAMINTWSISFTKISDMLITIALFRKLDIRSTVRKHLVANRVGSKRNEEKHVVSRVNQVDLFMIKRTSSSAKK